MIAFLGNTLRPWILEKLVPWFQKNIPIAIEATKEFFKGLWEFLKTIGTWIVDVLIGVHLTNLFNYLFQDLPTAVAASIQFFTDFWGALGDVNDFILDDLIPTIDDVVAWLGEHIPAAILLAIPGLSLLTTAVGGVTEAVKGLISRIKRLIEWLAKIEIPSILQGFSPSPLEQSLLDIGEAFRQLNTVHMPQFAGNLGALSSSSSIVSNTTNTRAFNLTLQTGQSSGSLVQDFGLMEAVAAGR
jgi:phage-related protein